jgi:hypothetical protein
MKALLIENSYPNTKYELRGGANDIEIMLRLIPDFDVTVLKDPSREKFIEVLTEFLKSETCTGPNPICQKLFYYSGHGSENEIITTDFKNINDEVFKELLRDLKGSLFAIFDSCFSGSMLDLKYRYSYEEDRLIENDVPETNQEIYLLSSSDNISYEVKINNKFNGLLTLLLEKADATTWRTLIRSIDELDNVEFPVFSTSKKIDMNSTLSDSFI